VVTHFLVTGPRRFPNVYVRTADRITHRFCVIVGLFDRDALQVGPAGDDGRHDDVGLAVDHPSPAHCLWKPCASGTFEPLSVDRGS
jgi:hypothetical protein